MVRPNVTIAPVTYMPRPRTPIKLRKLAGNPGGRPIPEQPEAPPLLDGEAPEFVSRDAREWYERMVPKLRQYIAPSELDHSALVMMACAWSMAVRAERKVAREGLVRDGQRNPAAAIWRDNAALFLSYASRFGLTPSDRARFGIELKAPKTAPGRGATLDGNWDVQDLKLN